MDEGGTTTQSTAALIEDGPRRLTVGADTWLLGAVSKPLGGGRPPTLSPAEGAATDVGGAVNHVTLWLTPSPVVAAAAGVATTGTGAAGFVGEGVAGTDVGFGNDGETTTTPICVRPK